MTGLLFQFEITYLGPPAGMIGLPDNCPGTECFFIAPRCHGWQFMAASPTIFVPKTRASGDGVTKFLPFVLGTPLAHTHYYYGYKGH
jgi:hypothetical protein